MPELVFPELSDAGTTLADVARAVALADVVEKVVKARREELRDGPLAELATTSAKEMGGEGLTLPVKGLGKVIQTAPESKVRVSDAQAFGQWLCRHMDHEAGEWVRVRERIEVVDHEMLVGALHMILSRRPDTGPDTDGSVTLTSRDAEDLERLLVACCKVVTEWFPAEDAVDQLLDEGWAVARSDVVYALDPDEGTVGDPVPGLSVSRARQSTYVKVDAKARRQVTAEVREALALGGGR